MHKHFANAETALMYVNELAKYPCEFYVILSVKKENNSMCTLEYFFQFKDTSDLMILVLQEFELSDLRKLDYLIKQIKWKKIDRQFKYSIMYMMTLTRASEYVRINDNIKDMLTKIEFSDFYE